MAGALYSRMPRVKQTARKNFTGPIKGKAARKAESLGVKKRGGVKPARKHRWHPGTVALREVRKLQKTTDSILAKAPFIRLVREIAADFKDEVRFTGGAQGALAALQTASEDYIIDLFEKANKRGDRGWRRRDPTPPPSSQRASRARRPICAVSHGAPRVAVEVQHDHGAPGTG